MRSLICFIRVRSYADLVYAWPSAGRKARPARSSWVRCKGRKIAFVGDRGVQRGQFVDPRCESCLGMKISLAGPPGFDAVA